MRSGRMRFRMDVIRRANTLDENGEETYTWSDLDTRIPCYVDPLSGSEGWQQSGQVSIQAVSIGTRYSTLLNTVTTADRIRFNGKVYDIKAISNTYSLNRELVFTCDLNERQQG